MSTGVHDSNTVKLYRAYVNVRTMVTNRKYTIVDGGYSGIDEFVRFTSADRNNLDFSAHKEDDQEDKLFVTFLSSATSGVAQIKEVLQKLTDNHIKRSIIICEKKLTATATKGLASFAPKYICEVFEERECQINITEHVLVPQHVLLTEKEKETLLNRYHLKDTQLPRIQQTDPIARYYGLRRGDVVKIVRNSETAGRYLTYRLCL